MRENEIVEQRVEHIPILLVDSNSDRILYFSGSPDLSVSEISSNIFILSIDNMQLRKRPCLKKLKNHTF